VLVKSCELHKSIEVTTQKLKAISGKSGVNLEEKKVVEVKKESDLKGTVEALSKENDDLKKLVKNVEQDLQVKQKAFERCATENASLGELIQHLRDKIKVFKDNVPKTDDTKQAINLILANLTGVLTNLSTTIKDKIESQTRLLVEKTLIEDTL